MTKVWPMRRFMGKLHGMLSSVLKNGRKQRYFSFFFSHVWRYCVVMWYLELLQSFCDHGAIADTLTTGQLERLKESWLDLLSNFINWKKFLKLFYLWISFYIICLKSLLAIFLKMFLLLEAEINSTDILIIILWKIIAINRCTHGISELEGNLKLI